MMIQYIGRHLRSKNLADSLYRNPTVSGTSWGHFSGSSMPAVCRCFSLCYNLHRFKVKGRGTSILLNFLPDSIIPWLLGGLLMLALFALSVTIRSWRESKRSPYFFLRMQAGKKMQRYLVASLVLILMTAAASAYAWQAPEEITPLVGILKHAKPNLEVMATASKQESAADESPEAVTINLTPSLEREVDFSASDLLEAQEASAPLTESTGEVGPENSVTGDAQLGGIAFALDISGNYKAIDPGYRFVEGFYTLYATFAYQGMADGMNWSWEWQRNGAPVDGGNQEWSYGEDGPGYIYFRPEDGFKSGEYSLAIWVDDELQNQAGFTVAEGVAANN